MRRLNPLGQESGFSFEDNDLLHAKPLIPKNIKEGGKLMKKIIGILLIGFLGFLGCSDNDDTTATVGQAIPLAPFGDIDTGTPTYEWTPVLGATRYQLLVQSPTGPDTYDVIIEEWFTADEAGCMSGDALCSVTPDVPVDGQRWKVLACAGEECGLWSDELEFGLPVGGSKGPRFTDHGDGTVTDNNTKLMWAKNANHCGWQEMKAWDAGMSYCGTLTLADYDDWRLPSLYELRSLVDGSQFDPALPPGNPFTQVQRFYWSSNRGSQKWPPGNAWYVNMIFGYACTAQIKIYYHSWPVRTVSD